MHTIADPARLDRMFFALADVHRRGMLDRLSRGPASVSELAEPLGVALPSAVKHLAVLEQGGFVVDFDDPSDHGIQVCSMTLGELSCARLIIIHRSNSLAIFMAFASR